VVAVSVDAMVSKHQIKILFHNVKLENVVKAKKLIKAETEKKPSKR